MLSEAVLERLGKDIVILIDIDRPKAITLPEKEIKTEQNIFEFTKDVIIAEKEAEGHYRTAENYYATLKRLKEFYALPSKEAHPKTNIPTFENLTVETIIDFENYLKKRNVTKNTTSFYLRIFRTICNRARKEGYEVRNNIFDLVYTGKDKTKKRALNAAMIRRIAKAEPKDDKEKFAQDLFVFSFITRGMSLVDIAKLTTANVSGKRLSYKRSKTGQKLSMEWVSEMKVITNRWKKNNRSTQRSFLFPIIEHEGIEAHRDFKRAQQRINYALKKLGKRIGIPLTLTMYVARHSWASLAKAGGISTTVIGDALGHTSEKTTRIYLDTISEERIDQANRKVIKMALGNQAD